MDVGFNNGDKKVEIKAKDAPNIINAIDNVLKKKDYNLNDLSRLMDQTSDKINETKRKKHTDRLFLYLITKAKDRDDHELYDLKEDVARTYHNADDKEFTLFDDLNSSLETKIDNADSKLKMLYNTKTLAQEEYSRLQSTLDDFSKEEVG